MVQLKLAKVVKMKKFIISFMCILLFSCHPIAVTFASVIENETVTFPVNTYEDLSLCKDNPELVAEDYIVVEYEE